MERESRRKAPDESAPRRTSLTEREPISSGSAISDWREALDSQPENGPVSADCPGPTSGSLPLPNPKSVRRSPSATLRTGPEQKICAQEKVCYSFVLKCEWGIVECAIDL